MKAPGVVLLLFLTAGSACGRDDQVSGDFGGACSSGGDCSPGARCLPNPTWPNGFCTQDCKDDTDCPSSAICVITPDDGMACLFECNDPRDCEFLDHDEQPGSWTCTAFTGGPMVRFACGGE